MLKLILLCVGVFGIVSFLILWMCLRKTNRRIFLLGVYASMGILLLLILLGGEGNSLKRRLLFSQMPAEIPAIAQVLSEQEDDAVRVISGGEVNLWLGRYAPHIDLLTNAERGMIDFDSYQTIQQLQQELASQTPDLANVRQCMDLLDSQYLVVNLGEGLYSDYAYEAYDFEKLADVNGWNIFCLKPLEVRRNRSVWNSSSLVGQSAYAEETTDAVIKEGEDLLDSAGNGKWTITQYGNPRMELQMMFYAIEDEAGHLVLIDGGHNNENEVSVVRSVIASHGNHVDAWIITHAHPDHVGAFNAIMGAEDDQEIRIDQIYTVDVNAERYAETAAYYDEIEYFEKFDAWIRECSEVTYLHAGDTFDLIGLQAQVLSAWDERVDALDSHQMNDGSLMFTISGKENAMLFCADVQAEMEEYILQDFADELNVDYVQLGHHGNWGLSTDFYDHTNPEAVFFDAPDFIIDSESDNYDGYLLKRYFEEREVEIFRLSDGVNQIILT